LVNKAEALHKRERLISLESVELVGAIERANAGGYLNLSSEELAERVGLTVDVYRKRAQAARVLLGFPQVCALILAGETTVSSLTIIAAKVTQANCRLFLERMPGKSAKAVARLAKCVGFDGSYREDPVATDVDALVARAQRAAAARGRTMTRR